MSAFRTTISMPLSLKNKAERKMAERDFASLSDYVQHLIREDTRELSTTYEPHTRQAHVLNEAEAKKKKKIVTEDN
jgi:Arc/MetJ-type ribon-helix-helix transcriptional regulator